jgi:hypothetical protein
MGQLKSGSPTADAKCKERSAACNLAIASKKGRGAKVTAEYEQDRFSSKLRRTFRWLPGYAWQRLARRPLSVAPVHLVIALADHFEPSILPETIGGYASRSVQEQRLERWCNEYPKVVRDWPDSDGQPFRHTYFYPAEQYDRKLIDGLVEHCNEGWGEIEIHLHHGTKTPDTAENTRRQLIKFRDALAARGCLSLINGKGTPRYAFVHGNFTLANSGNGVACGVDNEMQILAETGCYADFTLPSAPNASQIAKINSLYECSLPMDRRAPHRRGRDLECGQAPHTFPLIVQGPLMVDFSRRKRGWPFPSIENSALTGLNPPTIERLKLWRAAAITVKGRPSWVFVKLHCHGMDPHDESVMVGSSAQNFLRDLSEQVRARKFQVHFVTAREMVNIILAACDGREGNPGEFRDYRFNLLRSSPLLFADKLQGRDATAEDA